MPAITDIPVPPAIVAPAKPASASSSSPEGCDGDFWAELAAVRDERQQPFNKQGTEDGDPAVAEEAQAQPEDAAAPANTVAKTMVANGDWQIVPQLHEEALPQTQTVQHQVGQAEQAADAPIPVATPVEDAKPENIKPKENKAADAEAAALPVAAPVTDVVPAMLPTPVAKSGETATAQNMDATTPALRASITEPATTAPAKPATAETQAQQSARADAEQVPSLGAQAPQTEAESGGQQQQQNRDSHEQPRDPSFAQKTDTQPTDHAVATQDGKPATQQTQPQQTQPQQAQAPGPNHASSAPQHGLHGTMPAIAQAQPSGQAVAHSAVAFQASPQPAAPAPDQLAFAISTHSKNGAQNFEIRLDPPELGRVEVKMTVDDTGKTQASLVVERPQTLELLKADAHNLEKALKESGLDLTQDGLNFSLKGQDRQAQQERNAPFIRAKILNMELTATETAQAHINAMLQPGSVRLDIRV